MRPAGRLSDDLLPFVPFLIGLMLIGVLLMLSGCASEREAVREALAREALPLLDSHDDYVRRDPDLAIDGALRHGRTQEGWLTWSAKIRAALDLIAPPRSNGGPNEPEPPEPPPIGPPVIEPGSAL
jgi:hypothetical protein